MKRPTKTRKATAPSPPGITPEQIAALTRAGASIGEIRAAMGGRAITPAERVVINRARLVARMKKVEAGNTPKSWRQELERLKCQLAEMDVEQRKGGLVSKEEVTLAAKEDAAAIKTAMLGMPNALAPQLIGINSKEAIRGILMDWSKTTLAAWHDSLAAPIAKEIK